MVLVLHWCGSVGCRGEKRQRGPADAQKSRGQRTGWEVALRPFGSQKGRRKTTCACALHPRFDGVDVTLDDQVKKRVCVLPEALCCWAVDLGVHEIGTLNAPEVLWLAAQAPDRVARKNPRRTTASASGRRSRFG